MERKITVVTKKPDRNSPDGTYKVIRDGIYWGLYWVGCAWDGRRFVREADPRDGLPYR